MTNLPAVFIFPRTSLVQAECELDDTSGGHCIFYNPVSRRRAVIPSHNRDVPKGTLMALLREAGYA